MSHGRRRRKRWRIEMTATKSAVVDTHRRRSLHRRLENQSALTNSFNWIKRRSDAAIDRS